MAKKVLIRLIFIFGIAVLIYLAPLLYVLLSTEFKIIEIEFPKNNESLFMKNIKRGFNYELTVISTSSRRVKWEEERCFIYKSGETLFYKIKDDTLLVYTTNKVHYPERLESKVYVKQIELTNPKFIKMKKNYKELGLMKFP